MGAFPFSSVKNHQIEGLQKFEKAGGEAIVMVNFRAKGINKTYYIDIETFVRHKKECLNDGIKSMPFKNIQETWLELTRTSRDLKGKLCWDMERLCDSSKRSKNE